ncbi:MAG TPA: hypothetical protein PK210_11805 [Bacteroidia bacterium]|nr:hypothetical protein [Bacteroidia bacterium]
MKTLITKELIANYIINGVRHKLYTETNKMYNEMLIFSDGADAGDLLKERRPSESDEILKYREKIYVCITESTINKVIMSLNKIRKSSDWNIRYNLAKVSPKINEDETLQRYCEVNYPYYSSTTNWVFNILLKNYLIDSNALCVVLPLDVFIAENEMTKPIGLIFNSNNVLQYRQDDYAIVMSTDRATYQYKGVEYDNGKIYYAIDTQRVQKWVQNEPSGGIVMEYDYAHNFGKLPAFKLGGIFKAAYDTDILYQSKIATMIPSLKEAVREYSDLQAGVVNHLHPTMWAYANEECKDCLGTGKVKSGTRSITCTKCKGEGNKIVNPYSMIMVKPPIPGQANVPTPPAGEIPKQIDIIKLQSERVEQHIYKALASINMEFLAESPLNQSGIAKEIDKDELNNFVNSVAEDLISIMDKLYYFINLYRNKILINNTKELMAQLPVITVPERYDIISGTYLLEELQRAKTAGLNASIIKNMEIEFANKKFNYDSKIKDSMELVYLLDPFPAVSADDKMAMLMNKGITNIDYIISCNISQFVNRALMENKNFSSLTYSKQMEVLKSYADEIVKLNSAESDIMDSLKKRIDGAEEQ